MNKSRYRLGQFEAHNIIIKRVVDILKWISVVLPCRYGKTDVIWLTILELYRSTRISCALVLSPNEFLRDQFIKKSKIKDRRDRYELDLKGIKYKALKSWKECLRPNENGEVILSSTIQLANNNADVFADWVDSIIAAGLPPPIIYIDEAHTSSDKNEWGGIAKLLSDHGAIICLLTATAMRSDGVSIPGFTVEILEESDISYIVPRPGSRPDTVKREFWEGTESLRRLKADYEYTLQQAWAENPPCLLKFSRLPFDVNLKELKDGSFLGNCMLSELAPSLVRGNLGKIVRDRITMRAGIEKLLTELNQRKAENEHTTAIVFVCNDDDSEQAANEYARIARDMIEEMAGDIYDVVIATSAEKEGKKRLESFADGNGDILICKLMAGLGVDIPTLKVCLDLSPVRQPISLLQRLMRIATLFNGCEWCTYIGPKDQLIDAFWEEFIERVGGEYKVRIAEKVNEDEVPRDNKGRPEYVVDSAFDADFQDSEKRRAEAELLPGVYSLKALFVAELQPYSHADIALRMKNAGIRITVGNGQPVDTGKIAEDLWKDIETTAKRITNKRMTSMGSYKEETYAILHSQLYMPGFRESGSDKKHLREINNIDHLRKLKSYMDRMESDETAY